MVTDRVGGRVLPALASSSSPRETCTLHSWRRTSRPSTQPSFTRDDVPLTRSSGIGSSSVTRYGDLNLSSAVAGRCFEGQQVIPGGARYRHEIFVSWENVCMLSFTVGCTVGLEGSVGSMSKNSNQTIRRPAWELLIWCASFQPIKRHFCVGLRQCPQGML